MKKSLILAPFLSILFLTTSQIPPVFASQTLYQKTIEGDDWKLNFYPKKAQFRLKKNGKVKCNKKVIQYKAFLACSVGYLGSNYKDEIYKAIERKLPF